MKTSRNKMIPSRAAWPMSRTRRRFQGRFSHQSANSSSPSNSTETKVAIARPVKTATMTCRRRRAVILRARSRLGWARAGASWAASSMMSSVAGMLFEVRKFAEDPFAGHDEQHQNEIKRRGPEFDFERGADAFGARADGLRKFIEVLFAEESAARGSCEFAQERFVH